MADVYCRGCHATFKQPPPPYGGICPYCVARGAIITLSEGIEAAAPPHPAILPARPQTSFADRSAAKLADGFTSSERG